MLFTGNYVYINFNLFKFKDNEVLVQKLKLFNSGVMSSTWSTASFTFVAIFYYRVIFLTYSE